MSKDASKGEYDPWTAESGYDEHGKVDWTTEFIEANFRKSLVARAKKRRVKIVFGGWLVLGDPALGDRYDSYTVTASQKGKYHCDCYGHMYGDRRSRRICSHVIAVMLFRRGYWRELGGGTSGISKRKDEGA